MRNMMAQMGEEGCDPSEMWRRMMTGFGETQKKERITRRGEK